MRGIKIPLHYFALKMQEGLMREGSLAEPDSHTKSGRESGDTRILSWS